MKKIIVALALLVVSGCSAPTGEAGADVAAPSSAVGTLGKPFPPGGRRITLDCGPGENASAVGSYGGVSVTLSCSNGRASNTVIIPSGNAYDFFVGVESTCCAVDAHPVGDSETFSYQYLGTVFAATLQ